MTRRRAAIAIGVATTTLLAPEGLPGRRFFIVTSRWRKPRLVFGASVTGG
jgi:hypothetical protein